MGYPVTAQYRPGYVFMAVVDDFGTAFSETERNCQQLWIVKVIDGRPNLQCTPEQAPRPHQHALESPMRRTDIKDLDIADPGISPSIGNDEIDFVPSYRKTVALLQVYPQLVSLMGPY